MENSKKKLWLMLMGILVLVEIIFRVCTISRFTFSGILTLVSLVFIALYGFLLYKVPHGNMLKYAMLFLAFSKIINNSNIMMNYNADYTSIILIIACAVICYCAGRLDRIKENRILFVVIDIIFFVTSIMTLLKYSRGGFMIGFAFFDSFIAFTTLMIAYFIRYKEHREAGYKE